MNHPPCWNASNNYQVRIKSSEQLLFLFRRYFRRQDVQAVNTDAFQGAKKSSNILVNVEELQIAERQIIKDSAKRSLQQRKKVGQGFYSPIANVRPTNIQREVDGHERRATSLYKLDPVLDEYGIFRADGRIKFSSLPNDSKHRVILHRESSVTELIICHYHQAILKHQGRGMSKCRLLDYWRELHRFQPHLEMCDVSKAERCP